VWHFSYPRANGSTNTRNTISAGRGARVPAEPAATAPAANPASRPGEAGESKDLADIRADLIDELTSNKISAAARRWIAGEARNRASIEKETFRQTLAMMVDFDTNYMRLVLADASFFPPLPDSLKLILYSRRFAKLLEDTAGGVPPELAAAMRESLRDDLRRYSRLVKEGQKLDANSLPASRADGESQDLIVMLLFRVNSQLLLIGERCVVECLPEVLETVDTLGQDVNWCAGSYACDKILAGLKSRPVPPQQQAALEEYDRWKRDLGDPGFFTYKVEKMPSFRSLQRPYERATSMGAPVDASPGTVSVELPSIFKVYIGSLGKNRRYIDVNGKLPTARKVVEFARKLQAQQALQPG
jgi:hypothetical protein